MKERHILFSAPMVRAILEWRKSQTRRIAKEAAHGKSRACPYGAVGDLLWVREPWRVSSAHDDLPPRDIPRDVPIEYLADGTGYFDGRYRHARFMPRRMSRMTLRITEVRVERLQEISNDDCEAEGIKQRWTCINPGTGSYAHDNDVQDDYRKLWIDINGPDSWAANPWVWVVSFERETP